MPDWKHFAGIDQLPQELRDRCIRPVDIEEIDSATKDPQIVWLGHASFLIAWRGKILLIDPVFAKFIGTAKRRIPNSSLINQLDPDAILVSHAHMDHLNAASIKRFAGATVILPRNSEDFLPHELKQKAIGLATGRSIDLGTLTILATEARHGGWRYPWQKGYTALSYLISDGEQTVYYAGDSAYGDHFKAIGESFPIEIALLPIGAYSPRWFLKTRHLNPPEAVMAAQDLKANTMIPYHFGTYRLSWDALNEALPWFVKEAQNMDMKWQLPCDQNLLTGKEPAKNY